MKKVMLTLAALAVATGAHASVNLVQNGGFESTSPAGVGRQVNALGYSVADWSAPAIPGSYVFIFIPGPGVSGTTADTTGSPSLSHGPVILWGPGSGSANGLTLSPDGGNFLGSDPQFDNGAITQTINGLVVGKEYKLSFDWAGAQQVNHNGVTSEGWDFSLGASTGTTGLLTDPSHGFTGWQTESDTFTATSTSEVLSFLAIGTPSASVPPFALLDGVSLTAVPEPATWAMMLVGFAGLGSVLRSRRKQAPSLA